MVSFNSHCSIMHCRIWQVVSNSTRKLISSASYSGRIFPHTINTLSILTRNLIILLCWRVVIVNLVHGCLALFEAEAQRGCSRDYLKVLLCDVDEITNWISIAIDEGWKYTRIVRHICAIYRIPLPFQKHDCITQSEVEVFLRLL